jgi:predicted transcriptional regulator
MPELSKKSEKIASAIYLITSFFDDKEPLKWRIRTLSTKLVSEEVKDKFSISKEILSLFSVAKIAGLISEMNYNILTHELSKFVEEVEKPLDLAFLHKITTDEKALPQPRKTEYIKDNITDRPVLKGFGAVSVKKNTRQSIIIGILKRKKEIMIKDVSSLINGCSEKTIQRELSAMVHSGVLRKAGEKRWSRYSLA